MALRTTFSSESWDKIYQAFNDVSFVSYDFDTIKQSLIDYTRTYFSEVFNDLVESSEYIAMLEMFAYVAEQLAYRVDMVGHENFITSAQRKQSILNLAKLISYKAARNIPVRGMVKLTSVTTSEKIIDSRGIDLSGLTILWNDPNNPNWKEQFFLIMGRTLASRFGNPQKTYQVGDVIMDLYALKNKTDAFKLGVYPFTVATGLDSFTMEVVPTDIDENGPFEREPDPLAAMSIIYADDGIGDGSDYTGFLMNVKQGKLNQIEYTIPGMLPNRRLDLQPSGINDTDVWVQKINDDGSIAERWTQVQSISEQNLMFNSYRSTRNKYEVDSRENDEVTLIFGDGDFSNIPVGRFRFWVRSSAGKSIVIQKNKILNQPMNITYQGSTGNSESCTFTFSLTTTLQNGSATESIEHIRRAAPATYYSQNRMVNGQDYNTFMLKDPTILRLKAINRTFAGQPKYIDWNDASGQYQNVKLFGDDLTMRYQLSLNSQTTNVSGQALIDSVLEPLLSSNGVMNTLLHISATDPATVGVISAPRRKFIEDNRGGIYYNADSAFVNVVSGGIGSDGSLKEKTTMQGLIDRHYYGEPIEFVVDANNNVLAKIPDPDKFPKDDSKIYQANVPRTIDGVNKFPPGDIGSGLQPLSDQDFFALRYNRYLKGIGNGTIDLSASTIAGAGTWKGTGASDGYWVAGEVITIELQADGKTFDVRSNLRGSFNPGQVGETYYIQPAGKSAAAAMFIITAGTSAFEQGDAFILDTSSSGELAARNFPSQSSKVFNLNGWWELLSSSDLPAYTTGMADSNIFTTSALGNLKQHSWVIFVRKIKQQPVGNVIGYEVYSRDVKLTVSSKNTKFWYNSVDQIIDSETKKRVFDNVKVLRSNKDSQGTLLDKSQIYDVVGAVKDNLGVVDIHSLEIVPSDMLNESSSGDLIADRMLQFEQFSTSSFEYFALNNPTMVFDPQVNVAQWTAAAGATYSPGAFVDSTLTYGRRQRMPALGAGDAGLDFMWQHFSPHTNIIDPSVTNIHDIYLMPRGYYDGVINYIRGIDSSAPQQPTPLELRSSYGYLLNNKMLSDTVVLHPGKIKLLFGPLAEPQLRAKFKIVKMPGATLTNERIKEEILYVINTYFDIDRWDFGDTFYATDLTAIMHQRLPGDVASVVLVPVYSTNSFGSLFTVESGHDEILQSSAQLSDIEIVEALTPTIIRQSK